MKALILTASGVEDVEFLYPYYRLREEGIEVDVASPDGDEIEGIHGYSFDPNLSFADADADFSDTPPSRAKG